MSSSGGAVGVGGITGAGGTGWPSGGADGFVGSGGFVASGGNGASGGLVGSGGAGSSGSGAATGSGASESGGAPNGGAFAGSGGANSGGEVGSGGSGAGPGSGGTVSVDWALIDDLEDGDVAIEPTDGREGYWYSYNETDPRPQLDAPEDDGTGNLAVHAVGTHEAGVSANEAYGGIGVDLQNADTDFLGPGSEDRQVYDASAWDGFEFRIKSGSGGPKAVRFEIVTTDVVESSAGGDCTPTELSCWDAFGQDIEMTAAWTTVRVAFDDVVQEGWGRPLPFDPAHVLGIAFEDLTTTPWDFWVDDMRFYEDEEMGTGGAPGSGGAGSGGSGTGGTASGGAGSGGTGSGGAGTGGSSGTCEAEWDGTNDGSITRYWFAQGTVEHGNVACNFGLGNVGSESGGDRVTGIVTGNVTALGGNYFGAMNTADYDGAAACGACVELSATNGATTRSVVLTIVDECPIGSNPLCTTGHIDLSVDAYAALQLPAGHWGNGTAQPTGNVSWKYVDCPVSGNVQFRLKENNASWNEVIVLNHRMPIDTVQVHVGGNWVDAIRQSYNFWTPPGGSMGGLPYDVRAFDIFGNQVQGELLLNTNAQTATSQFACE